jgi:hypothetical protein
MQSTRDGLGFFGYFLVQPQESISSKDEIKNTQLKIVFKFNFTTPMFLFVPFLLVQKRNQKKDTPAARALRASLVLLTKTGAHKTRVCLRFYKTSDDKRSNNCSLRPVFAPMLSVL